MSMVQEFKEFAMRGNVVDMAVGVIVGGAFGKITTSLVNDVVMPPIGYILGNVDFSDLALVLVPAAEGVDEVAINYGLFLNNVINFLIIAFCIFVVVKGINSMKRTEEEKPEEPPAPSKEEVLLTEIRDALKSRLGVDYYM